MGFVTEIVLFRARPGIAAQTVAVAAEGPAIAGPGGTIDRGLGTAADGLSRDTVIDGPGVRLYHCRSLSL